ncbi:hypothetical protein CE91St1_14380 [Parabacteroides goldsteinii]|nr:hypothetical protein CE91St1_14380 [Parabacteroides goldsteinii]GKG78607.1 hypothetical protein CE91St2_17990 [Parabacteroides goldsteinii]
MAPEKSIYYEVYLIVFIIGYNANHGECHLLAIGKTIVERGEHDSAGCLVNDRAEKFILFYLQPESGKCKP